MGLFKKLLGGAPDISLEKLAKGITDVAEKAVRKVESYAADSASDSGSQNQARPYEPETAASGFSWGKNMPMEENQYNYHGNYVQYFDHIFREDFPGYQAVSQKEPKGSSTIFTVYHAGRKALVVELKSEKSESNRVRRACQMEGTPYLRFYYDHHGWWNTREYVVTRVRSVLR